MKIFEKNNGFQPAFFDIPTRRNPLPPAPADLPPAPGGKDRQRAGTGRPAASERRREDGEGMGPG